MEHLELGKKKIVLNRFQDLVKKDFHKCVNFDMYWACFSWTLEAKINCYFVVFELKTS